MIVDVAYTAASKKPEGRVDARTADLINVIRKSY